MSFHLKQYIQQDEIQSKNLGNETYMTLFQENGQEAGQLRKSDRDDDFGSLFDNECVTGISTFNVGTAYYFHGKIYRLLNHQDFTVKLTHSDHYADKNFANQYIRSFTVNAMKLNTNITEDRQYDIEFIFVPFVDKYNTIVFELTREEMDFYIETRRNPIICYEEISIINNVKSSLVDTEGEEIVKLGIQSRPNSILCLNQEGIRVPKSGIQELKDGTIPIDFISFVSPAKENVPSGEESTMEQQMKKVERGEVKDSKCFFNSDKKRPIKSFAIDYVYSGT